MWICCLASTFKAEFDTYHFLSVLFWVMLLIEAQWGAWESLTGSLSNDYDTEIVHNKWSGKLQFLLEWYWTGTGHGHEAPLASMSFTRDVFVKQKSHRSFGIYPDLASIAPWNVPSGPDREIPSGNPPVSVWGRYLRFKHLQLQQGTGHFCPPFCISKPEFASLTL